MRFDTHAFACTNACMLFIITLNSTHPCCRDSMRMLHFGIMVSHHAGPRVVQRQNHSSTGHRQLHLYSTSTFNALHHREGHDIGDETYDDVHMCTKGTYSTIHSLGMNISHCQQCNYCAVSNSAPLTKTV